MTRHVIATLLVVLAIAASPAIASASEWVEGTAASPFALADDGGLLVLADGAGDPALTPPYETGTAFNGTALEFEPRSLRVAKDGSFLVACGKHGYVLRILPTGGTRMYSAAEIPGLERPFDAFPLDDGGMLIVDRGAAAGEGRVVRVDSLNRTVWQFGGTSGLGSGELWDPFSAEPLGNGHTLISDSLGYRIIEVDDASGSIVWSYGTFKVPGPGAGLLARPHSAQRLLNGNTLICDADGHKVIEVTHAKQTVWSYGTGARGSAAGQLFSPNSAVRLANGDTIISDSDNNRVLVVDAAGRLVQEYGVAGRTPAGGGLSNPRAALRLADGSTVIADLGNMRLARYGYRPRHEYVATSGLIDPSVGAFKAFTRIVVSSSAPAGTSVVAEYTADNRTWKRVPANGALPAGVTGTAIRYRVRLSVGDGSAAPTVGKVSITWNVATPSGSSGKTKRSSPPKAAASTTSGSTTGGSGAGGSTVPGSASVPGGTTQLPTGVGVSTAGAGGAGLGQSTLSGWVMSESQDEASWAGVAASSSGPAPAGGLRRAATPSVTLLLVAYVVGIGWSPGAQFAIRLIATASPR